MPIKGVSDVARLPRLGKIRLGIRKENASGVLYPCPTDHFVCPEEVRKVFGEKPKELRIMFPTEDQTQWASQYLKCYSATRGLVCKGDGERAMVRVDGGSSETDDRDSIGILLREIPCSPDECLYYQRARCRRVMNLQFLVPECPGSGVYQLDTSSFYSIANVKSGLDLVRGICDRVAMIPISLKLVDQEVMVEGKWKTVKVLDLRPTYSLIETQKYGQTPPSKVLLLPTPDNEVPDDLFPDEILDAVAPRVKKFTAARDYDFKLLWEQVKNKVWQIDVQDWQIANWFQKFYGLDVGLQDFKQDEPPPALTAGHLEHLLGTLRRHSVDW